jgi:hypothetical protein
MGWLMSTWPPGCSSRAALRSASCGLGRFPNTPFMHTADAGPMYVGSCRKSPCHVRTPGGVGGVVPVHQQQRCVYVCERIIGDCRAVGASRAPPIDPPASLPHALGGGGCLRASCCSMAADRSTARTSATPRAARWGMRQPVPEPTSMTRLAGPRPGSMPTAAARRCVCWWWAGRGNSTQADEEARTRGAPAPAHPGATTHLLDVCRQRLQKLLHHGRVAEHTCICSNSCILSTGISRCCS